MSGGVEAFVNLLDPGSSNHSIIQHWDPGRSSTGGYDVLGKA